MKLKIYILILLILLKPNFDFSAVTSLNNGGRFGDCLFNLYRTLYFSVKYKMPFLYTEFNHSNELMLHKISKKLINEFKFKKIIEVKDENQLLKIEDNYLYKISFYVKMNNKISEELKNEILEKFKKLVSPVKNITFPELPDDIIKVAVHVRKGSGNDLKALSFCKFGWPSKFPPDSFYIDQINNISRLLNNVPLYIYIFTDNAEPELIAKKYKKILNKSNITFGYPKNKKDYESSLINDFFFMTKFDCLIRPTSLFSMAAEKLANFKIVIQPSEMKLIKNKQVINKVSIDIKSIDEKFLNSFNLAPGKKEIESEYFIFD